MSSSGIDKVYIGASVHSSLMYIFLMGAYIACYCGTVSIYLSRRGAYKRPIIISLTGLLGILIAQACIQWYMLFQLLVGGKNAPVASVVSLAFANAGYIVADGLLIWRCYHACGSATWPVIFPLFFFVCEIALGFTDIAIDTLLLANATQNEALVHLFEIIDGTFSGAVAATSLLATYAIARRIHASTSRMKNAGSRSIYHRIVEIIVQSSLVYSLAALVNAVFDFVNANISTFSDTQLVAGDYVINLTSIITGLSPTLMVARLAITSQDYNSTTVKESQDSNSIQLTDLTTLRCEDSAVAQGNSIGEVNGDEGELDSRGDMRVT